MAELRKGEWSLTYDDGSDKVSVSFDVTGKYCPTAIKVEYSSDFMIYVDVQDAPWIAARLLDAAASISRAKPTDTPDDGEGNG